MSITNYMSWEGGVDLVGLHGAAETPNIIVHVARMVHTPVGSAPAGIILIQPDPTAPPTLMGFVSSDLNVAGYFGPKIFAGTPFENAPVLEADITISINDQGASSKITIGDTIIESSLSNLGATELITREPSPHSPVTQQVLEAIAGSSSVTVNGEALELTIPEVGTSGGPGAVYAPAGLYAR